MSRDDVELGVDHACPVKRFPVELQFQFLLLYARKQAALSSFELQPQSSSGSITCYSRRRIFPTKGTLPRQLHTAL